VLLNSKEDLQDFRGIYQKRSTAFLTSDSDKFANAMTQKLSSFSAWRQKFWREKHALKFWLEKTRFKILAGKTRFKILAGKIRI
jgi:hypothetical protein